MTLVTQRVFLDGEVTEKKARHAIHQLHEIHTYHKNAPIEFVINSQGGTVTDGTAIYSELAGMSLRGNGTHHVTTKVRGMCGSIATVIFQAGDDRVGGELDMLIFHEPMVYVHGDFLSSVRQRIEDMERWEDRFLDIIWVRAEGKANREDLAALSGPRDKAITIPEAIRFGLADRVA